jgi:hypothetical protein
MERGTKTFLAANQNESVKTMISLLFLLRPCPTALPALLDVSCRKDSMRILPAVFCESQSKIT